jgi:nucleotide-binding universal stress UspA family protein
MIKNILCGVDASSFSDIACDYAIDLAKRLGARLEAVHIVDSRMLDFPLIAPQTGMITWNPVAVNGLQEALRTRGTDLLRQTAARGEAAGLPLVTTLEFGHPSQVLAEIQTRTELVVIGRQGEHAKTAPDITGSTMERFIRHASRPCLVTPGAFQPITRILAAIDGSASAARALHEAIELANALHAPLVILVVAERDSDLLLAQKNSLDAHSLARAHECAAATLTAVGPPALRILEAAAETASNLVVLGSHGHGWIYDRLIGSAAAHVVSRGQFPVLLVR